MSKLAKFAVLLVGLVGVGCRDARKSTGEPSATEFRDSTIGSLVNATTLSMTDVRLWYSAMRALNAAAESDSTLRLDLRFPLDDLVRNRIDTLRAHPRVDAVITQAGLTGSKFIALTVLVSGGLSTLDSNQANRARALTVWGEDLARFFAANRDEIVALNRSLTTGQ